jgi:hypothetical protein
MRFKNPVSRIKFNYVGAARRVNANARKSISHCNVPVAYSVVVTEAILCGEREEESSSSSVDARAGISLVSVQVENAIQEGTRDYRHSRIPVFGRRTEGNADRTAKE